MPNNPPPNPSVPPNGKYNSTCGTDFSSWDGSFTYTDGAIAYTCSNNPSKTYNTTNGDNGNAINFTLSDTNQTVKFNGPTFAWDPDNKAKYSGNCHLEGPGAGEDGWTATQTS